MTVRSSVMLHWGLLLVAVASVAGDSIKVDGDKWVTVIPNEQRQQSQSWTLTADQGSTIKVFCPDARFAGGDTEEERCRWSTLVFDDGIEKRTWCGTQYDFQVVGKTNKMTIDLTLNSLSILECLAKAVRPAKSVEEVKVAPGEGVRRFTFPKKEGEHDKAWRFKSTTNKKISLQCELRSEGKQGGICIKDIITVNNGEGPKQHCGYDKVVVISANEKNEINLRVESYPTSKAGLVDCQVQSISGPSPNEYENVDIKEVDDSSEIGVVPGKKGTTCDCGRTNQQSSRIINGTQVGHEGKFPFMVSLRTVGDSHFCGASIISPVHILTAAHCVSDSKTKSQPVPQDLVPTVGAHDHRQDSSHGEQQRLRVKKVSIPDQWFATNNSLSGDIAILHLETPIKFSKWVSPVCLTPVEPPIINTFIKAMGWGYTENGTPNILMEANVQVLDKAVCHSDPKEICFKAGPSSSCFGDSGGPYVWADPETNRYTQVGLVSYGYGACTGSIFVGSNTVYYYDWIKKTMAETSTEHEICVKID